MRRPAIRGRRRFDSGPSGLVDWSCSGAATVVGGGCAGTVASTGDGMAWFAWFSPLQRQVQQAEAAGDTQTLAQLAQGQPQLAIQYLRTADKAFAAGDLPRCLLYAVALCRNGDARAADLLRRLTLACAAETWGRLADEEYLAVAGFLRQQGDREAYDRLAATAGDPRFVQLAARFELRPDTAGLPPRPTHSEVARAATVRWLATATQRPKLRLMALSQLATLAETGEQPADRAAARQWLIREGQTLAAALAQAGTPGGADTPLGPLTRELRLLSLIGAVQVEPAWIRTIGQRVRELQGLELCAAAELIAAFPDPACLPGLQAVWVRLDNLVRRDLRDDHRRQLPLPGIELQACRVAHAMAACAAADEHYRNLDGDEQTRQGLQPFSDRYQAAIDQYNTYLEELKRKYGNSLSQRLQSAWCVQETAQLAAYEQQVKACEQACDREYRRVRAEFTPGFSLLHAVNDGQRYPITVRQGAAFGLFWLLREGHLDAATGERFRTALAGSVHGREGRDFRERRVFLFNDYTERELIEAVRQELHWMEWLTHMPPPPNAAEPPVAEPTGADAADGVAGRSWEQQCDCWLAETRQATDWRHLPAIFRLVSEELREAVPFFAKYPLRLMLRADQQTILGLYRRDGCRVVQWTRYQPRDGTPDVPGDEAGRDDERPRNAGPVTARYLDLDDRTPPNSMGLDYLLFHHPLLVVPVLYHEFLHHAGVTGEHGLSNETEVHVREMLFFRRLMARLAPDRDADLPAYEQALLAACHATHTESVLLSLQLQLGDPDELRRLDAWIVQQYGRERDEAGAAHEVQQQIDQQNQEIARDNFKQSWDPHMPWPLLGTEETRQLTTDYRRLLAQRWTQRHWITWQELCAILAEPVSQECLAAWEAYLRRRPPA